MPQVTRKIGLSLGADVDWPTCFEDIVTALDLAIPFEGDDVRVQVDRLRIDPFNLRHGSKYDLVIDRLTHWYHTSREWIKKAVLMDGLYVFNNPWSVQSMEKHTSYCAMIRLGMPIPETWLLPPKEYENSPDLETTLERYAELFDLGAVGTDLGYPSYMKPYDGGGWVGVSRVTDEDALKDAYEKSGKFVMHLQRGVEDYEKFVRCVGVGPQLRYVLYDPDAPLHQRYGTAADFLAPEDQQLLSDITLTINTFFGWDFNSCECLLREGVWYPIDFANPCPDSQVTSLHRHFPWLVKAKIRWAVFCAVTKRRMRPNLDWGPFFDVAAESLPYREKLHRYAEIARSRLETDRFEEFCAAHLPHLDEVAWEYFGTDAARAAVRAKVEALFPADEHDEFTDHFMSEIQTWRDLDAAARPEVQS